VERFTLALDEGWEIRVSARSDVGCVRENNEDFFGVFSTGDPARGALLVVADGMGGAAAGEVASRLAVETTHEQFFRSPPTTDPATALRSALEIANRVIHSRARSEPRLAGMGTTCTAVAVRDRRLWHAHVGDSRAYLVHASGIRQITRDHSLAAEIERTGGTHVAGVENILTRCLGPEPLVELETGEETSPLESGMRIVLCSDGLTNQVEDGEIHQLVSMRGPEGACGRLVDLARERGAPDNVTVVVAEVARIRPA
jgi:protein phosphatase